jgi:hypothetical protein
MAVRMKAMTSGCLPQPWQLGLCYNRGSLGKYYIVQAQKEGWSCRHKQTTNSRECHRHQTSQYIWHPWFSPTSNMSHFAGLEIWTFSGSLLMGVSDIESHYRGLHAMESMASERVAHLALCVPSASATLSFWHVHEPCSGSYAKEPE